MSYVRSRCAPRPRAAFTLVELMVVIAIIGVLLSLTAAAVYKMMGASTQSNTFTLLSTLKGKVKRQWQAVADRARKENIPSATFTTLLGPTQANGDSDVARAIWVNYRLNQAFPTTWAQLTNPNPNGWGPPLVDYTQMGAKTGVNATIAGQPYESAALLLLALEAGPESDKGGIGDQINYYVGVFSPTGQTATAANQAKAFKDGWGNPLTFTVAAGANTSAAMTFAIGSAGPDGVYGTGDDLSSATLP